MSTSRILFADDKPGILHDYEAILSSMDDACDKETDDLLDMFNEESTSSQYYSPIASADIECSYNHIDNIDYHLVGCSQGQEAIDIVEQSVQNNDPFAVAFIDMRMPPGINGLETIQQLYGLDCNIQLVVVTAYSDYSAEDIRQVIDPENGLTIIKKPFEIVEIRRLATTLSKKWLLDRKIASKNLQLERMNSELLQSQKKYQVLFDYAPVGYIELNMEGIVQQCNRCFADFILTDSSDVVGQSFVSCIVQGSQGIFLDRLKKLQNSTEKLSCTAQLERKHKGNLFVRLDLHPMTGKQNYHEPGDASSINLTITDLTDLKVSESMLIHQAFHDALTSLPNRRSLEDSISKCIASAQRRKEKFFILYLDLDNFKDVNDSIGHDIGDQLLVKVTTRLLETCRREDTVARVGGDEFVILQSQMEEISQAHDLATKILQALVEPITVQGNNFAIGCSIGIAVFPDDGDSSVELLKKSDIAMYEAKQKGKNNYVLFSKNLGAQVFEKLRQEKDLLTAIESREFEVFYQPKMSLSSGKVTGMEALVRWIKTDGEEGKGETIIAPDTFIPLAEESGLIVKLGELILDIVAEDLLQWKKEGRSYAVAINLSPIQLLQHDLVPMVTQKIIDRGIDPAQIDFEVTENIFINTSTDCVERLTALKNMGFSIALDDFGTGYASLSYLKKLPIDVLKIDKSFIDGIPLDQENSAITRATVTMAAGLHLKVVAEGVEKEEQLQFLKSIQCDEYQGYLYSKPMPYAELVKLGKLD